MLFFIFWPLPEKLLDCSKKIILPDSGGGLQPPSSYAYVPQRIGLIDINCPTKGQNQTGCRVWYPRLPCMCTLPRRGSILLWRCCDTLCTYDLRITHSNGYHLKEYHLSGLDYMDVCLHVMTKTENATQKDVHSKWFDIRQHGVSLRRIRVYSDWPIVTEAAPERRVDEGALISAVEAYTGYGLCLRQKLRLLCFALPLPGRDLIAVSFVNLFTY